jgi:magnesium transporter
MSSNARLYRTGSDRAEEVAIASLGAPPDDRSILWLDCDTEAEAAGVIEQLGLTDVAQALAADKVGAIALRAEHVRFSMAGLNDALSDAPGDAPGAPTRVRLEVLLARNIVVSVHAQPIRGLRDPIDIVSEDPRFGRLDAGRFAGLLLGGVLHGYDAAIEDLEEEIDDLDERALREGRGGLLETMVSLRQRIALLRRWLAPSRAVFATLTRPIDEDPSPIGVLDPDLLAHLDRTLEGVERCRDQLLGSFDIVMTRTNQRTNDVMRMLTVLSAVLLPAIVIAGVMGMNFQVELFDEPVLFYVVVGAMLALAALTLIFARWRRWI